MKDNHIKGIKSDGQMVGEGKNIKGSWRENFNKLLNEDFIGRLRVVR